MARRIVRTFSQIVIFIILVCGLVFFADTRYRVLPDYVHSALPNHHPGSVITDVTITFCSTTNPFAKCALDPTKWHRIEKDLYLGSGWFSTAWLHIQRKKEEELTPEDKVVMNVRVARLNPGVAEKDLHPEEWESRPGGIWLLRSSNPKHNSDSKDAVTALDVLFGSDSVEPRLGWEPVQTPLLFDAGKDAQIARLTLRRGHPKQDHKDVVPRVGKDGTFKILQVSDLHLATGIGQCRDAIGLGGAPSLKCEADPRTLEFLEKVLDDEKPNLVVLSGDQVEGPASPDTQSTIFKYTAPLIERSLPYAAIFGNHDDESKKGRKTMSRASQMSILESLPFSLSKAGPEDVDGVGNYVIEVLGPESDNSAITIYMLDSHSLTPDEKNYRGYDWIKPRQINWFKTTAQSLKKAHAKYSHIHLDMAFIHIPLPEFADQQNYQAGGHRKEYVTAPGFNSHFYDALAEEGIIAVGCGHDHVNDYCALRPLPAEHARSEHTTSHSKRKKLGPWMCYAGGSGFGGYAGYGGFHRRMRVWEFDMNAGRVTTWKRVECCGEEETKRRVDELVIVEGGHVVAPSAGETTHD